jgi:TRAP-type C4-dicarboxylate transport system permease small subunit
VSGGGLAGEAAERPGASRLRHLTRILSAIAGFCLFAMMAMTFADVLGRYVFAAPINGAFEIVEFLLALVIFSGLPLVALDDAHINVSIFDKLFRPHGLRLKKFAISLGSAAAVGFIADRLWSQATEMARSQAISGVLEVDLAPVVFAMAALAAATCVVELVLAVEQWRAGAPPPPAGPTAEPANDTQSVTRWKRR